jgi:hypothetical protein
MMTKVLMGNEIKKFLIYFKGEDFDMFEVTMDQKGITVKNISSRTLVHYPFKFKLFRKDGPTTEQLKLLFAPAPLINMNDYR